jgi:MFS family permease
MPALNDPNAIYGTPAQRRRNGILHVTDGAFFIGGLGFVNVNTLLPGILQQHAETAWMAAWTPVMMPIGLVIMPILTAHFVSEISDFKRVLRISTFIQRLPYLIAAVLLMFVNLNPFQIGVILISAPLISGLIGGAFLTLWQQFVMATIPPRKRSMIFGWRFLLGSLMGVLAGWIIREMLTHCPGKEGYGMLHFICFVCIVISYKATMSITVHLPAEKLRQALPVKFTFRQQFAQYASIFSPNPALRNLGFANIFLSGLYLYAPYVAIHLMEKLEKGEQFLGYLLMWQMIGSIPGNLLAGWIGERRGSRQGILIGMPIFILTALLSILTETLLMATIVYFLWGLSFFLIRISADAIVLEVCPREKKAHYLAGITFLNLPGLIIAPLISYGIWSHWHRFDWIAWISIVFVGLAGLAIYRMRPTPSD